MIENEISLSEKQYHETSASLAKLAQKCQVHAVFLIDSGGRIMAKTIVKEDQWNIHVLGALTASHFAASTELARQLGENEPFQMVLYEGKDYSVFMTSISHNANLVVLFSKETAVGMVRLFTKKTAEELETTLQSSDGYDSGIDSVLDDEFQNMLNNALDEKFKEHLD